MLKSKLIIFLCFLFCSKATVIAQHHISKYEVRWAIIHPITALKVKSRLDKAMAVYSDVKESKQLDSVESGGTLDAFRHSFTMAYLAQKLKPVKLRKLGVAHEKGNKRQFEKHQSEDGERADSLACEVDLRNNELGFLVGSMNKSMNIEKLKLEILTQIKLGNAWILKKNSESEYVSCENVPILIKNYKNQWFLPKCLIKSNEQ